MFEHRKHIRSGPRAVREIALALVRAMHAYGAPVHRLEFTYERVCSGLGVEGVLLAEPTSLVAIVEEAGEQRSRVVRMGPAGFDLGRWAAVEDIAESLSAGDVDVDGALYALDGVVSQRSPYPMGLVLLAHAVVAGTAVGFLGGGWSEVIVATAIGGCLGILAEAWGRSDALSGVFEAIAGFVAGLLASTLLPLVGPGSVAVTTTAGLIGLVPGFTLTVAMTEVATHHLSSGTARLAAAAGTFLALGFGVAVGGRVGAELVLVEPLVVCTALPEAWRWISLGLGGCGLGVLFGATPRDMVWALLGALVADVCATAGGLWLGDEGGAFMGALGVGLVANLFARVCARPSALVEVPGIMVLVPGSVGLRSLTALLSRDVVTGIEVGVAMMMTAVALVVGVLLAKVLVPPRA